MTSSPTRRRERSGSCTGVLDLDPRLSTPIREAKQHYDAALQAQRNIDWAKYGEEMRKLGEVLERIR